MRYAPLGSLTAAGYLNIRHKMKFFTLVLFNTENLSNFDISEYVRIQMEPFKLIEDDDLPYNKNWKWDYYCLYEKEHMKIYGFEPPEFESIQNESEYVVYQTSNLKIEHMVFALLTPIGEWINGPYPLQEQDETWPERALEKVLKSNATYGVYVYCHS